MGFKKIVIGYVLGDMRSPSISSENTMSLSFRSGFFKAKAFMI